MPKKKNAHIQKKISSFLKFIFPQIENYDKTNELQHDFSKFFTPLNTAFTEIMSRRNDLSLVTKILKHINNDLPSHFNQEKPLLYFSRYIATPNYETLRFIEQTKDYNLPLLIGEDLSGKFVSKNETKRALAKMPVIKGINRYQDEILENFTLINFDQFEGKNFDIIKTKKDIPLYEVHHKLLKEVYPEVRFADESLWINRHARGDLLEHYKQFLSLFIINGIMFEIYYPNDREFVQDILEPAFNFVTEKFGHRPLICRIESPENVREQDMITYPSVIYPFINEITK